MPKSSSLILLTAFAIGVISIDAAVEQEGSVTYLEGSYLIGDDSEETAGSVTFTGVSSPGSGIFKVYEDSTLNFQEGSHAGSAQISLYADTSSHNYPSLIFSGWSDARNAEITNTGSELCFKDMSSAESSTIRIQCAPFIGTLSISGVIDFSESATAGTSIISIEDGALGTFFDYSTADESVINLGSDPTALSQAGFLDFLDYSDAGNATINVKGGYVRGGKIIQSSVVFDDESSAKDAIINIGDDSVDLGGKLSFYRYSNADRAVINASRSSSIVFCDWSQASQSAFELSDAASLTFKGAAKSGTASINMIGKDTSVTFSQVDVEDFQGCISGNGTIYKSGPGTLNFNADGRGFSGSTVISQGIFSINSILNGNVEVKSGGVLKGNGKVEGEVVAKCKGVLSPGASTLTIDGKLTQEPGSIFQVLFDREGSHSLVNVNGIVELQPGAILTIIPSASSMQLVPNTVADVAVMQASEGIIGSYENAVSSNPLINGHLSQDANGIYVQFYNTLSVIPTNAEQAFVSTQLQSISAPSIHEMSLLQEIAALPPDLGAEALQKLSGEQYSNMIVAAEMSNQQFIQRLYNPVRTILTTDPCCSAECFNTPSPWNFWIDTAYTGSYLHGKEEAKGYKAKGYEITVGAQKSLARFWTFGLTLLYEKTHFNYNLCGESSSNSFQGAFYGVYRPSDYYVLGDLIFGSTAHKLTRIFNIGGNRHHLHGDPKILNGTLYIEAGKDYRFDWVLLQPFIGIEGGLYKRKKTEEYSPIHSVSALNIDAASRGTGHSRLGLHATSNSYCGIVVAVDLAWRYRFTSLNNDLHVEFRDFGDQYIVQGVDQQRNSFDGALTLNIPVCKGWNFWVEGNGQFWHKATSFNGLAGLSIDW